MFIADYIHQYINKGNLHRRVAMTVYCEQLKSKGHFPLYHMVWKLVKRLHGKDGPRVHLKKTLEYCTRMYV